MVSETKAAAIKWWLEGNRAHARAAKHYRAHCELCDGLAEAIKGGRVTAQTLPDDFEWLAAILERIRELDTR